MVLLIILLLIRAGADHSPDGAGSGPDGAGSGPDGAGHSPDGLDGSNQATKQNTIRPADGSGSGFIN